MKTISREAIIRMTGGARSSVGGGVGGGNNGMDLSGYALQSWVDENYLSIAFFRNLFRAYESDGTTEVLPNGEGTTIDNIKAMFGFWTDQYLSALGQNSSGGGGGGEAGDQVGDGVGVEAVEPGVFLEEQAGDARLQGQGSAAGAAVEVVGFEDGRQEGLAAVFGRVADFGAQEQ